MAITLSSALFNIATMNNAMKAKIAARVNVVMFLKVAANLMWQSLLIVTPIEYIGVCYMAIALMLQWLLTGEFKLKIAIFKTMHDS